MKTIFMTVYDGMIARNLLRTSVLSLLSKETRVVLFCPLAKLEYYRRNFDFENVYFEATPPPTHALLEKFFWAVSFHSIPTKTLLVRSEEQYIRSGEKRKLYYVLKRLLHAAGHLFLWRAFLRKIYFLLPDRSFKDFFEIYRPDLAFATNMIHSTDADGADMRLLKQSKKGGIKTVGMMKSWDSITTKAFVSIFPDYFLSQNETIKKDITKYLDYPLDRISITGFPQFDQYFQPQALSRADFFKTLGLDPSRKLILYIGAGYEMAPHDPEVMERIYSEVASGSLGKVQILLRPHPKFKFDEKPFLGRKYMAIDAPVSYVESGRRATWEFEDADIKHFINIMFHADVVVNVASTTCIETALFNVPVVSISFDGDGKEPYALSVLRYHDSYECIIDIINTGGVTVAYSFDELRIYVQKYLADRTYNQEGRKRLLREVCGPFDGKSGERVARAILKYLNV